MGDQARDTADVSESSSEELASGSSFLHRPIAVVTLIGGIVASVTAIAGLTISVLDDDESSREAGSATLRSGTSDEADGEAPEIAVDQCLEQHGLASAYQKDVGGTGGILFRHCVWPPPSGAGPDGYTEISVASRAGPGRSEAEGLTIADYVTSTCRDIELIYLFDSQGTFVPEDPILLSKGEIRRIEGGSIWQPRNEVEASLFSPIRDQSIVMSNSRYLLESARCT